MKNLVALLVCGILLVLIGCFLFVDSYNKVAAYSTVVIGLSIEVFMIGFFVKRALMGKKRE